MRSYLAVIVLMAAAVPAGAQDWYVRGTFGSTPNPFDDTQFQMIDQGGGHYTRTVGGFFDDITFEYKIANLDFTTSFPSTNGKVTTNADGEMNFHLRTNNNQPWNDGWAPNNVPRAGYDDSQIYDWEVVGSFNSWPGTGDPAYYMTDMTNGLHEGTFTIPTAGEYQFKFRRQGSWDASIGLDFGNGNNIPLRTWSPNETVTFKLDLPNGRYQVTPTLPTPDLNSDGYVDTADYVLWRKSNGSAEQYTRWRAFFGTVPPPPDTSAFYARASWNGFDLSDQMVNNGGGLYTHTETGLTTGTNYDFKAANNNYSIEAPPGGNVRAQADANGEVSMRFYFNNTWTDGWMPNNQYRIGYKDPGLYGWELMGEFNGFAGGSQYVMTNNGSGLYSVIVNGLAATTDADGYGFKFRRHDGTAGNWDISIGANFGNFAPNAQTGVLAAGNYKFELDLFNGRWRVTSVAGSGSLAGGEVPEPASLALAMVGLAFMGVTRRKK